MSSERTRDAEAIDLREVAEEVALRQGASPCAVVGGAIITSGDSAALAQRASAFGARRGPAWRFGWGAAGRIWTVGPSSSEAPAAAAHHIFDLASLSKPVTALLLARLQRDHLMHRDEPLGDILPEVADSASGRLPLDLFLAHRAGLVAHEEYFVKEAAARQPARHEIFSRAASARRAECAGDPPAEGFPPVYSDLGYILVGAAIERRTGRPIDELVAEYVARPLGLSIGSARLLALTEPAFAQRVVPTEDVAWRGGVLRGVVHDENAWVLAGSGSAGHAGLFGDVWSLVRLGTALLDALAGRKQTFLGADDLAPLLRPRPGGTHRAGFDSRGDEPSSGEHFGPKTFGHLGFTGTSLWMDPDQGIVGVLLTNRVHPTREHVAIRRARPIAYDMIWRSLVETP